MPGVCLSWPDAMFIGVRFNLFAIFIVNASSVIILVRSGWFKHYRVFFSIAHENKNNVA
jgi:hypothetical protein